MGKKTSVKREIKRNKTELILYEKNIYKALTVTALPLMLSNFIIALLDIADTFFVGRINNASAAQAGIGIAWPVINIMLAFNNGLSAAGIAVISRMFGEDNQERAAHYGGLLLLAACVMGISINILLFAAATALMRFMGAEGDVLNEAAIYLKISSFEMLPLFLFTAFCAMRQSMGDMVVPVIFFTCCSSCEYCVDCGAGYRLWAWGTRRSDIFVNRTIKHSAVLSETASKKR